MWHSCRQNEKMITGMMSSYRKRAERRKAYFAKRQGDPLQTVQLSGTSIKLYKDPVQYYSAENEENLMPWQGQHDNKIDRFDARSMLDIIFEYDSKTLAPPTEEERELESLLNYERYRCIIDNYSKEVSEAECVEQINTQKYELPQYQIVPPQANEPTKKKATGPYAAVGFSYENDESGGGGVTLDENEDDDSDESENEYDPDNISPVKVKEINGFASRYGIFDFYRLLEFELNEKEKRTY